VASTPIIFYLVKKVENPNKENRIHLGTLS